MSSIKDVAKLAQVSIATVSRYINSPDQVRAPTARRVAAAIAETGYKTNDLARRFRMGKTQQIVVAMPEVGAPFYAPIVEGVRRVAEAEGYNILIMETAYNISGYDEVAKLVMQKQTDGIILLSALSPFEEPNFDPEEGHPPIVLGLESIASGLSHFPCVCIDNRAAAMTATRHLLDLGHTRIGFINGQIGFPFGAPLADSALTKVRSAGFYQAMEKYGLPVNPQWIVEAPMKLAGGREAARRILALPEKPTALFCANDNMAIGALFEVKQAGLRVPEDISIIGFDNIVYTEVTDPPLTTIEQPAGLIGELSMRRLLRLIAGEADDGSIEFVPHRLVKRQSCAPPPAEQG